MPATTELVIASSNPGKLKEFAALLKAPQWHIVAQTEFAVPDADETGLTFVENAIIKARNACLHTRKPALADDSGIEVDYLGGEPGIYSARYAGRDRDDSANREKLLEKLIDVPTEKRTARFRCVIVMMRSATDPSPLIAQGEWRGQVAANPSGRGGFGYDPVFYVPEHGRTAAELNPEHKNQLSHRGAALRELQRMLAARPGYLGQAENAFR